MLSATPSCRQTAIWISIAVALVSAVSSAVLAGINKPVSIFTGITVFLVALGFFFLLFRKIIFIQNKSKPNSYKKRIPFLVLVAPWLFPRQIKFLKCEEIVQDIQDELYKVKDPDIRLKNREAMTAIGGLLKNFKSQETIQGKVEEKLLPLLQNVFKLITRWINHESGELPLEADLAQQIHDTLLKTKDLVLFYQKNSLDQVSLYLASLVELQTDMESSGINPDDNK